MTAFKIWVACGLVAASLAGCSGNDKTIKTSAGYPPVTLKPSGLPTYAVGDRFTFNNPEESWTVVGVRDGLVKWRSSRKAEKVTVFDPVLPPIVWTDGSGGGGTEHLTAWDKTLFPLKKGLKIAFKSNVRRKGATSAESYIWKCYSGGPRKVNVEAGTFPAYPIFCRRSDGFTRQSFHAPEVNGPLLITTRKRPAPSVTRELISYEKGSGPRIAATAPGDLPNGWAIAAVDPARRPTIKRTASPAPPIVALENAKAPNGSGSRSLASSAASPPLPSIPSPPAIPAPKSVAAKSSAKEALDTVAVRAPQSPIALKDETRPSATPTPKRSSRPATARTSTRARSNDAKAPALPSIPPPASVFGQGNAPPPPVIAPPARVRFSAPSADKPTSPATLTARRQQPAPRAIAATSFGVQLGSYGKPEMAADGWKVLRRRFGALLKNWNPVVRRVDLGPAKGAFYRLIAGPARSRKNAETLCAALKARDTACLVRSFKN